MGGGTRHCYVFSPVVFPGALVLRQHSQPLCLIVTSKVNRIRQGKLVYTYSLHSSALCCLSYKENHRVFSPQINNTQLTRLQATPSHVLVFHRGWNFAACACSIVCDQLLSVSSINISGNHCSERIAASLKGVHELLYNVGPCCEC